MPTSEPHPDRARGEADHDRTLDAVVARFPVPAATGPWRPELRARSLTARRVLLEHPWAPGLLNSGQPPGPSVAAHEAAVLECLRSSGFSAGAARQALDLLDAHLYGSVLLERSRDPARRPPGSPGDDFEAGLDLVLDALARLLETTATAPVEVLAPVLGVDGCRSGWVGAVLVPGAPRPRVVVAPTIAELVEAVRADVDVRIVGIDIPIGLPDDRTRQADALARRALRGKASSVFTTITREAYAAGTRAEADAVNRRLSGQGVGAQAFSLRGKILEVDAWVRSRPTVEVLEVHPELCFAEMAGSPLVPGKRTEEGRSARLEALAAAGIARPSVLEGSGYAADDVLDACAAAWTAARRAAGLSRSLPDPPEVFSDGIAAAIHV